jgi:hypothetical protein
MAEQFEMLPFGGRQEESELERQIMRGGMARGGERSLARPMNRHGGPQRPPSARHGHHGPRHGLRYPYGWPYWAPAYWGWSYPAGATVNVFDDGAQDGPPDDADDAPVQGEALRPHRAGCRCVGCCRPVFDVLPFTLTQLATLEGRNNWRSRRR